MNVRPAVETAPCGDDVLMNVPSRLRRLPGASIARGSAVRFLELEGIDRSMALAGQAFAALLPLMIVVSAASPKFGRDVADSFIAEFRLSGTAAEVLRAALAPPGGAESSASALGALLLVISALSFTRALQRLYVRAWRVPSMGLRGNAWGALWLVGFIVFSTLEGLAAGGLEGLPAVVTGLALSTVLWLLTPWVLVGMQLPWQQLLPQALLTTVGVGVVSVSAVLYAPRIVRSAEQDFGVLGVGVALLTLLFILAAVLVVGAAIGATLAESRHPSPQMGA
jgi:membrane protein